MYRYFDFLYILFFSLWFRDIRFCGDLMENGPGGEATADQQKFILIGNKSDLLEETPAHLKDLLEQHCIFISAKRKENINLILERLVEVIGEMHIQDTAVVSNVRHFDALNGALKSTEAVLAGLHEGLSGDLITVDLRTALHYLGEITGEITTDEILGNIFGRFCVGK